MPFPLPQGSIWGCRGLLLVLRLSGTLCFPRRHQNAQGCLLASPKNLVLMVLHSWEGSKIRQPLAQPKAELRPGRTRELGRIRPDPCLGPHGCARRALQGPPAFHCPWQVQGNWSSQATCSDLCSTVTIGPGAAPAPRALPWGRRAWTATGGGSAASPGSQRGWRWPPSCSSPRAPFPAVLLRLPRDSGWALPQPKAAWQSPPRSGSACGHVGKVFRGC